MTQTDLEKKPLQTKNSDEKVNLKKIPRQEESNVNLMIQQKKYENTIKHGLISLMKQKIIELKIIT